LTHPKHTFKFVLTVGQNPSTDIAAPRASPRSKKAGVWHISEISCMKTYMLKGRQPVLCGCDNPEMNTFSRVALTEIGTITISTVFLGIDHGFSSGPPVLFETMIFGGKHDQYQCRSCTYDEAEEEHIKAVEMVKNTEE
jgi:hypothetical protein